MLPPQKVKTTSYKKCSNGSISTLAIASTVFFNPKEKKHTSNIKITPS